MKQITVLLADDHAVVRDGLRALLQDESGIQVVGEAENGREAVQLATQLMPDVVVMDIAMPVLNGLEATRQITQTLASTRVLILSCYSDDEYIHQLAEAGAMGYLVKETGAGDVIRAIREVHLGNAFFSPSVSQRLMDHYRNVYLEGKASPPPAVVRLTSRETEVLQLIAEGRANKQIASDLCISIKTVEKHRQQVMNKLNIHEIAGLTRYAITRGITEARVVMQTM